MRQRTVIARIALVVALVSASGASFGESGNSQQLDLRPSLPPQSDIERSYSQPPPVQPTRTPLQVLERGEIPHSGNSQLPSEGFSPTFDPPGATYRRTFE